MSKTLSARETATSSKSLVMRSFLCNELEPVAYVLYMLAVVLQLSRGKLLRHQVLFIYYAGCAVLIYMGILFSDNNNWSYNLLFFFNICVSSWYYYHLIAEKPKRMIIVACWLLNVVLFAYVNIVLANYGEYNNYVYGISFISIVLYSFLYLHQLLVGVKEENLLLNFDFWLICGFLLYFLGCFIIVLYYDNTAYKNDRGNMWQTHNIILFFCSLLTLLASLYITKKNRLHHV